MIVCLVPTELPDKVMQSVVYICPSVSTAFFRTNRQMFCMRTGQYNKTAGQKLLSTTSFASDSALLTIVRVYKLYSLIYLLLTYSDIIDALLRLSETHY